MPKTNTAVRTKGRRDPALTVVPASLTPEEHRAVRVLAAQAGQSMSSYVTTIVREHVRKRSSS